MAQGGGCKFVQIAASCAQVHFSKFDCYQVNKKLSAVLQKTEYYSKYSTQRNRKLLSSPRMNNSYPCSKTRNPSFKLRGLTDILQE